MRRRSRIQRTVSSKAAPSGRSRHRSAATARSEDQGFPWSNTMGDESRDDAFKKGTKITAAGLPENRAGFHPGQHSPPPAYGTDAWQCPFCQASVPSVRRPFQLIKVGYARKQCCSICLAVVFMLPSVTAMTADN